MAFKLSRPGFGIQSRMLLVTFALGSVFVVYVVFNALQQADRDRENIQERMRLNAAVSASRLDDHIGDTTQFLTALGGTLGTDSRSTHANDIALSALAEHMPRNVLGISVWDIDGNNIGDTRRPGTGARPNAETNDYFLAALQNNGLVTQAPVRLDKNGDWVVVFALPIVRAGRVAAVVSAQSNLMTLGQAIQPAEALPEGAVIAVVDNDGLFLARSIDAERYIGRPAPIDRAKLARRLKENMGTSELIGAEGVRRIFGIASSRSEPWLVYVGYPLDAALAPSRRRTLESLLLGLALLAGGLVIAAWVAARITRPLRQLSADAALLGEGHFAHRSSVRTASEIGLLASTFNAMAATLQERIAAGRRGEERLILALEGSGQSLFDWDIANQRIYFSAKAAELRGGPAQAREQSPEEMRSEVHPDDLPAMLASLAGVVRGDTPVYAAEFRARHANGGWVWLRSRGRIVERDGRGQGLRLVGTEADITQQKAEADALRQRAEFDLLTGLPNRALFNDRMARAVARAGRSGTELGLLFIDIDHFKTVNDTRGHAIGDELLKVAALRLREAVRATDTVARLAGDEFTVILEGLNSVDAAQAVAGKIIEALSEPVCIGELRVETSASVGVAMLESGESDPKNLLLRADAALYDAKRRGRNRYATRLSA